MNKHRYPTILDLSYIASLKLTCADTLDVKCVYIYKRKFLSKLTIFYIISRQWAILASASGIATNAVDMTKWMNFHLRGGRNDLNVSVMNSTLVDMLHAPRVKLPHDSKSWQPGTTHRMVEDTYAYGWKNGHYRGGQNPLSYKTVTTEAGKNCRPIRS